MKKEKKEMISVTNLGQGQAQVRINFSSLDLISTCMRKTYYSLERGLVSNDPSPALVFGTGVHKALETWYLTPPKERRIPEKANDIALKVALGFIEPPDEPLFLAIREFAEVMAPLRDTPSSDKRSIDNGVKILVEYFKRYIDDGMEVLCGKEGKPYVEIEACHTIFESPSLKIDYFGTIDIILRNPQTGIIAVADHKTTASLGSSFYSRLKPNHQYTGYVWLAQKALGLETNLFMVNGIQVAKTKQDFARQFTERTEEDFLELQCSVIEAVERYLTAKDRNYWSQNSPQPCTMYGACSYLKVCEVKKDLRERVITSLWQETN